MKVKRKSEIFRSLPVIGIILIFALISFSHTSALAATKPPTTPISGGGVCAECHEQVGGKMGEPVNGWKNSIHKQSGVGCAACHGGDPNNSDKAMSKETGFKGKFPIKDIPELCASCHADIQKMRQYNLRTDQFAEYKTSVHGKRLYEKNDTTVATCVSCHGTHEIRKKDDPLSRVYHTRIPETCGECHADPNKMKPYNIPTNQLSDYKESYHGLILYGKIPDKKPSLAPTCADCHGTHGATPPGIKEVANVCGNCHSTTAKYFKESPHFFAMEEAGVPRCVDCHTNHRNKFPTIEMFAGGKEDICTNCHEKESLPYKRGQELRDTLIKASLAIEEVKKEEGTLEKTGKNIEALVSKLQEAEKKLVEAAPISHSLDVKRVKELSEEAGGKAREVKLEIEKIYKDILIRKIAFVIVALIFLAVIALMILKLRQLSRTH